MFPEILSVPFGFDLVNGKLIQNEAEMRIISKMQFWRSQGKSYDSISDKLNFLNIPSKRDRIWYGGSVNKILKRESEV